MTKKQSSSSHLTPRQLREAEALRENLKRRRQGGKKPADTQPQQQDSPHS